MSGRRSRKARRALREMLRKAFEIPHERGRRYYLHVQLVSGDDERPEATLGQLTLNQLRALARGPGAAAAAAAAAAADREAVLFDVATELLRDEQVMVLDRPLSVDTVTGAIREHYSTLLDSQSHAAYGSGYRKAQAAAAAPPVTRVTGGGAKLTNVRFQSNITTASASNAFDLGQLAGAGHVWSQVSDEALGTETVEQVADKVKRVVNRARWEGATEAAASAARQLYGAAGAHVTNAADLIALVRSDQDRRVDPTGVWKRRSEQVRADTLRAVASWLAQNWGVRLDSNPEWLTTPEALGARITSAADERVARATAHTYTEIEIHNAETRRETRVCRHLLTAVGAPVPEDETELLVREDVAAVLRKKIDEQARERVSRLQTVGINEGRHAMARFVMRGLNHPDKDELDPERPVSTQVAAEMKKAFAHTRWRTLRKVADRLYGPDPADNTYGQVPKDMTAEQFADALMKDRDFRVAAGDSPANDRYAELRQRYSAEHDAAHHTRDDFIQAALALLLGPHEAVQVENTTGDGHRLTLTSTPAQLWRFADTMQDWEHFTRARKLPDTWRATEAAALLMCALDLPPQEQE